MNLARSVSRLSVSVLCLGGSLAATQEVSDTNPNQTRIITVTSADQAAAETATSTGIQFLPAKGTAAAASLQAKHTHPAAASSQGTDPFNFSAGLASLPSPGYFVTDVSYNGGPVITDAINYPVYVNTTPAAVGYPGTLLRDLGKSQMVHVIDQYVGLTASHRYTAGIGISMTYPSTPAVPFHNKDIRAIVHAAAASQGETGYHTVYHVFLPAGQDVCSGGSCYSPDDIAKFGFCAYHDSFDFKDIGHVIYSLEPYQAVPECQTGPPSPNGLVIDSTLDTLSHEFFESISDPDGTAWYNTQSLDENGEEVADICVTTSTIYPVVKLNGTLYELQAVYSNVYHGCAYVP